jgi:hypothetical protein
VKRLGRGIALAATAMAVGVAVQRSALPQQTQDQQPGITVFKSPT